MSRKGDRGNKAATKSKSHVLGHGNKLVVVASREAIGAMKYKAQ